VRGVCCEADIPVVDKKKGRPTGAIKKRAQQIPAEETETTKRVTRAAAKVLTFS
jgi:hypothetical protein